MVPRNHKAQSDGDRHRQTLIQPDTDSVTEQALKLYYESEESK
jgi:hypothetical protein